MNPDEFDLEVAELEVRLERLRSLYEQYFHGIERIEPSVARKDVDRRFWAVRKVKLRNTAKRFKLQTLIQRYNTLQQHWAKVCRQIENGTYVRHIQRAQRRAATAGPNKPRPKKALPGAATGTTTPTDNSLDDARVAQLHKQLVETQQRLQPGSRGISHKALAESLRVAQTRLSEKHADRHIDFRVVERDGLATIQPVLRKTKKN